MSKNILAMYLLGFLNLVSSAVTAGDQSPVARIVLLQGNVTATSMDLPSTTGPHSLAQIAFIDGGMMTLNAESSLRILDFVWNGAEDGTERVYFELLNGGFCASSGKIGHKNSRNYKVHTPQADVGINGDFHER